MYIFSFDGGEFTLVFMLQDKYLFDAEIKLKYLHHISPDNVQNVECCSKMLFLSLKTERSEADLSTSLL